MTMAPDKAVRRLKHDIDDRPMIVIWEVTRACQLVCRHCRADSQPQAHPEQLTPEQGLRLLEDIASFGKPLPIVILTGGDPFERPDLHELLTRGSELGLHMALSPSVTPRLTGESVRAMHAAGANSMSLSLDGAKPETHDAFRGFSGVFDSTLAAGRAMREDRIRLQVNSTVTRDTMPELPDLLRIMFELEVSLWSLFFLVPTGRGQQLKTLDAPQIEDVLHWMADISDMLAVKTTEAPHFRRVLTQRARAKAEGRDPRELEERGETYAYLTRETERMLAEWVADGHEIPHRPRVRRSTSTPAADSRSSTTAATSTPRASSPSTAATSRSWGSRGSTARATCCARCGVRRPSTASAGCASSTRSAADRAATPTRSPATSSAATPPAPTSPRRCARRTTAPATRSTHRRNTPPRRDRRL
ncbi:radical SAM protein [Mobilicoccus caccae]|uniref:Radical SAM core domain-containing protein n=1 Tax=Mobilicoccus caccae TaxID=1859295 RepID=A0ABQ6IMU6_9MICO|nr:radical SAM protein [Mobilicoccus caccae]GMA38507.1 hypothetical protein GCM10025883_05520 [Mobilicoccus caccae]